MGKSMMVIKYLYETGKNKINGNLTSISNKYLLGTSLVPIKTKIQPFGMIDTIEIVFCEMMCSDDTDVGYRTSIDITKYLSTYLTKNKMNVGLFLDYINKYTNVRFDPSKYDLMSLCIVDRDNTYNHYLIKRDSIVITCDCDQEGCKCTKNRINVFYTNVKTSKKLKFGDLDIGYD